MFDMIVEHPMEDTAQLEWPGGMLGYKTHWQGMQEIRARRVCTMAHVIKETIGLLLKEKVRKRHKHRLVRIGNVML